MKEKLSSKREKKIESFFAWLFALIGQTTCRTSPGLAGKVHSLSLAITIIRGIVTVREHSACKVPSFGEGQVLGISISDNRNLFATRHQSNFSTVKCLKYSGSNLNGQVCGTDNFISAHFKPP